MLVAFIFLFKGSDTEKKTCRRLIRPQYALRKVGCPLRVKVGVLSRHAASESEGLERARLNGNLSCAPQDFGVREGGQGTPRLLLHDCPRRILP